ncbi:hypothetical protein HG536_0F04230 [Torulaspora globosa]|uniref:BHLH domain-containing protein n=1 Tax=Torulaspora globosa TaxID=48254 RepID=A0A7G3ZKR1_9SACH|nr:uncharacterized protein HG536_0F04230 [Torulaspora globosa]QLL34097.1 hypothetical protein HG536_0F04230 [Torulaspora globosa]
MNSTMLAAVAPHSLMSGGNAVAGENGQLDDWIFSKQGAQNGEYSDSSSWSWFEPLENIISSTSTSSVGSPIGGAAAGGVFGECEPLFADPSSYANSPDLLPAVKKEEADDEELRIGGVSGAERFEEVADLKNPALADGKKKRAPRKRLTSHQKQAHNRIEKRYRININTKIAKLQQIIPWVASEQTAFAVGDSLKKEDGSAKEVAKQLCAASATKLNKSMILEKAVDYILYLQNSERLYEMEVQRLKDELDALKKGR